MSIVPHPGIAALIAKAAAKQAAVNSCDGHLWLADYHNPADSRGSSACCVRCGERRGINQIGPEEKWQLDVPKKKPVVPPGYTAEELDRDNPYTQHICP